MPESASEPVRAAALLLSVDDVGGALNALFAGDELLLTLAACLGVVPTTAGE